MDADALSLSIPYHLKRMFPLAICCSEPQGECMHLMS